MTIRRFITETVSIFKFPAILYGLNFLFDQVWHLYYRFWWFDIPMHFLGGVSIALAGLTWWKKYRPSQVWFVQAIFIWGLVSLAATGWELYEFGLDRLLYTTTQPSLPDTMKDLAVGLTGGLLTICIHHLLTHKKTA